jgi:uncharacterized protein (TIRG00374 family)
MRSILSVEVTPAPIVPVMPLTPELPVSPEAERPPAIGSRLRSPSALISLLLPIVLLGLLLKTVAGLNFGALASSIASASPLPLLVGALVFYGVFPLRGWRWAQLLHGAGIPLSDRDAIEILSLSWFVNCVVPARLGDVYRAWLLRRTSAGSGVNGLATVVVERGLDLLASAGLAVAAGLWLAQSGTVSVGDGVVSSLTTISAVLFGLCVVVMLVVIKTHARILPLLPLSPRLRVHADRFFEGLHCLNRGNFLPVVLATLVSWSFEVIRLTCVVSALHLVGVNLSLPAIAFTAMAGALLSVIPLTPAGLGLVEAGVIGLLTAAFGLPPQAAAAIALLDRAISTYSVIVLGGVLYVLSPKTRAVAVASNATPG